MDSDMKNCLTENNELIVQAADLSIYLILSLQRDNKLLSWMSASALLIEGRIVL